MQLERPAHIWAAVTTGRPPLAVIKSPLRFITGRSQMKRREFIAGLGMTAIGVLSAQAQQPVIPRCWVSQHALAR